MTGTELEAQRLRDALADQLRQDGVLTDDTWERAAGTVPRELFLDEGYFRIEPDSRPTLYEPVVPGAPDWLEDIYRDTTLVTQLDGSWRAVHIDGPVEGVPTSSSTMPSLVLRMWHQLGVESGMKTLEIGTGTGYSTALGCHRLGEANLTSIEVDPDNAARAAAALESAGYWPHLVVGDGLDGHQSGAPYDRLIATCAVRHIPYQWIDQVRDGGVILATVAGWMHGFALARLTVGGDRTASGRFLPGRTSFMMARQHDHPPHPRLNLLPGDQRNTGLDPAILSDPTGRWVAQLSAPTAQHFGLGEQHVLMDVATGSQARVRPDAAGGWIVIQRGPLRLWDQVEEALQVWHGAGRPHQSGFGITVTPDGQRVWLHDEADGPSWKLPI